MDEPTRGVDVGARAEIYSHLRRLADRTAWRSSSRPSDLPEVLGLADTIATFYRGRLVRVAPAADLSQAEMMRDVTHERAEAAPAAGAPSATAVLPPFSGGAA